jgi:hypothetical protein
MFAGESGGAGTPAVTIAGLLPTDPGSNLGFTCARATVSLRKRRKRMAVDPTREQGPDPLAGQGDPDDEAPEGERSEREAEEDVLEEEEGGR